MNVPGGGRADRMYRWGASLAAAAGDDEALLPTTSRSRVREETSIGGRRAPKEFAVGSTDSGEKGERKARDGKVDEANQSQDVSRL